LSLIDAWAAPGEKKTTL